MYNTGWGGSCADNSPDTIFKIAAGSHGWLFERVQAVVHHGGAGTTAAGLRAGKPAIICPFFGDQPFWGRRVAELGVGAKPIPQKKLTAANLAEAIDLVTSDSDIRWRAEALGQKIRSRPLCIFPTGQDSTGVVTIGRSAYLIVVFRTAQYLAIALA